MALVSARFSGNKRLQDAANNNPVLKKNDPDQAAVRLVQEALVKLKPVRYAMPRSTRPDGSMDGIYGDETFITIQKFQIDEKLLNKDGKPDGRAGHDTLHRLDGHMVKLEGSSGSTTTKPHKPVGKPGKGMCGTLRVVRSGRLTGSAVTVSMTGGMDAVFNFNNTEFFEARIEIQLLPSTSLRVVTVAGRSKATTSFLRVQPTPVKWDFKLNASSVTTVTPPGVPPVTVPNPFGKPITTPPITPPPVSISKPVSIDWELQTDWSPGDPACGP